MKDIIKLTTILTLNCISVSFLGKAPTLNLIDGRKIPMIGIGSLYITDEKVIKGIIEDGIDIGYRHIDTSYFYKNEEFIGQKLRQIFGRQKGLTIKRRNIFVTSKLWNTFHARNKVIEGLRGSLQRLDIGYLDLYLIHFPFGFEEGTEDIPLTADGLTRDSNVSVVETWKAMEDVYRLGMVKSIGVSNFNVEQLRRIMRWCQIKPVVNQIELNPYLTEEELVDFCQLNGIQVVAYSPLSKANQTLLNEPVLKSIAKKYRKSVAQVIMRWIIQRNIVVVPGTSKKSRLLENFQIFDFNLTKSEMKSIFKLNRNWRKTDFAPARFNSEYPYNKMGY